jgi:serine/threonine-protein kinase
MLSPFGQLITHSDPSFVPDQLALLRAALAGRYTIEHELGRGGMAMVYQAEDLKHQRKVALKVLRPELSAVLGAERFLAEIRVTAGFQHPHVVPLFDSGTAGVAGVRVR